MDCVPGNNKEFNWLEYDLVLAVKEVVIQSDPKDRGSDEVIQNQSNWSCILLADKVANSKYYMWKYTKCMCNSALPLKYSIVLPQLKACLLVAAINLAS